MGTDITFDTGLIDTFGCNVIAVDPTPKSITWLKAQSFEDPRFTFIPVGISGGNGRQHFYAPRDPSHVSHSIKNLQHTTEHFSAEVLTIAGLMNRQSIDKVHLVKLDIEGAEHDAIRAMLRDGVLPQVICVEFDQPEPISWGRRTTKALQDSGYDLVKIEHTNLTFILQSDRLPEAH